MKRSITKVMTVLTMIFAILATTAQPTMASAAPLVTTWVMLANALQNPAITSVQFGNNTPAVSASNNATITVPASANITVSRGLVLMQPVVTINNGNSENVRIYIEGNLNLNEPNASAQIIWNVEFIVLDGGSLSYNQNNTMARGIVVMPGGTLNGVTTPNVTPGVPKLEIYPAQLTLSNAYESYEPHNHTGQISITNTSGVHTGIINHSQQNYFKLEGFPNQGIAPGETVYVTIAPIDGLAIGQHSANLYIFGENINQYQISIDFEVIAYLGIDSGNIFWLTANNQTSIHEKSGIVTLQAGHMQGYDFSHWAFSFYINNHSMPVAREILFITGDLLSEQISFSMPNAHVVATAVFVPTQTTSPNEPTNRLFVAMYLYGEFVSYAAAIVHFEGEDDKYSPQVHHDTDGTPFVLMPSGEEFFMRVDAPEFFALANNAGWQFVSMADYDKRVRLDFVGLYAILVDGVRFLVPSGEQVDITAVAREGYIFAGWDMDGTGSLRQNVFTMPTGTSLGESFAVMSSNWIALQDLPGQAPAPLPPPQMPNIPSPQPALTMPSEPPTFTPSTRESLATETITFFATSQANLASAHSLQLPEASRLFVYEEHNKVSIAEFLHMLAELASLDSYTEIVGWANKLGLLDSNRNPQDFLTVEYLKSITIQFFALNEGDICFDFLGKNYHETVELADVLRLFGYLIY